MTATCPIQGAARDFCRATVWAYAFRPFFLLSCAYGILMTAAWASFTLSGSYLPLPVPASEWHAHEMLFGFVGAALAGFILTAAPSWTNSAPVVRGRLIALVALWLAGRVAMWCALWLPGWLVAGVNLGFMALLLAWLTGPIFADPSRRHRAFPLVLLFILASQALVHWGWIAAAAGVPARGFDAVVTLFVLLIVITVSRISVVVINVALEHTGEARRFRPDPARNTMAWLTVALYAGVEFAAPATAVAGWIALAAAAAQFDRLTDWHVGRALLKPYVLILYAAYWWIAIGLALIGLHHCFDLVPASAGRHALTTGAMGSAILAVFVIAGMRHTGREFLAPPLGAAAFVLMNGAALARSLAPILTPELYGPVGLGLSSLLFMAALGAYGVCFTPKLLRPRVDGKEG
jgi:uncharacterized protein involved in response to NO